MKAISAKKAMAAAVLLAALSTGLYAGGSKEATGSANKTAAGSYKLVTPGELNVVTSPDYPPYESVGPSGEYIGLDMDMARAIAKQMGLKCHIVPSEFDGVLASVSGGKADIAMAGLHVTAEREKHFDFTTPIGNEALVILVKKGSPIKTPKDLAGKIVGSQSGTTCYDFAKYDPERIAEANFPASEIGKPAKAVGYDDCMLAAKDLEAGKIDAVIYENTPLQEIAAKNPGLEIVKGSNGKILALSSYFNAYITKKGNGFAAQVNKAIADLKASGELKQIFAKYPMIVPADKDL
jgi:polar amino acid transport system substrate-binding protein